MLCLFTDLAGKYRGLEFTRHLFEGHDDGDECDAARSIRNLSSGDLFENPEQSFRITKTSTVKSSWMARGFLGVWAVMLVLPEDVQGLVLEDLMMVLTYIVTLVKDVIYAAEQHIFITGSVAIAVIGLAGLVWCCRPRENRFLDKLPTEGEFTDMAKANEKPAEEKL